MTPREEYQQRGSLTVCPNPSHIYGIGRVRLLWRWGGMCWSDLTDKGHLITQYFAISKEERLDGTKATRIILGPLILMIGVADDSHP